jgi:pyruvate dehydrogenase E1 component alpha subunit
MVRIRHFEETVGDLAEKGGRLPGSVHLSVGQEAVAAGVIAHLGDDDKLTTTHRGHGHLIAKGGEPERMFAELFGKATGYCKGKGGSLHIVDMKRGMLGANGIVGAGIPIALGAAFSNKFRMTDSVAVAFFGDGALDQGTFHESANMAALYQLPLILVCENNFYAEFTPQDRHQMIVPASVRSAPYAMPGETVDGMDVLAVYAAAERAIGRARSQGGPTFLECQTYRYFDHVGVKGMGGNYRTEEEKAKWRERDPIAAAELRLIADGSLSVQELAAIHADAQATMDAAVRFAEQSPEPSLSTLLEDVYQ